MGLPVSVVQTLPILHRVWLPILNLAGKKCEYRIIITSPDYIEFRVLWGLISFEKGEKREFVVRGTEAYIDSIISSLEARRLNARLQQFPAKRF